MQKNQPPQKPEGMDREAATSWAFYIACLLQLVTQPILRTGAGVDQPGLKGLIVLVLIPLYGIEMRSAAVMLFWQIWCGSLLIYRIFRDRTQNSYFMGEHWLLGLFIPDFRLAGLLEGPLVMAVGYLIQDKGLRWLLMASGGASLAYELAFRHMEERRAIAYRNAVVEMENQQRFH